MMTTKARCIAVVLGAAILAGCQDLVVENTNQPDRDRALREAAAVEALAASTYPVFFNRLYRGTAGFWPLTHTGDEVTSSQNTSGARDLSTVPRQPYDNNPVNTDQYGLADLYWNNLYEAFANATDVLRMIDGGLLLVTGDPPADNTHRARVFAKLMQGLALGYIGLVYDQAYIYDESTPEDDIETAEKTLQLVSYSEVSQRAIQFLDQAIQIAESGPDFTIPARWMYAPADLTRADLVRIANAYATRFMVLTARTPTERAAVDWAGVNTRGAKVTADVRVAFGASATGQNAVYLQHAQSSSGTSRFMASNLLIGPADVSGNYQAWLASPTDQRKRFLITTPDRRITGATPNSNGRYFRYVDTDITNSLYGTYRQSYYQWYRNNGVSTSGSYSVLPLAEINLYRAEAFVRLNQLDQAAELINRTRTTNGSLPAVTAAGVPESTTCVPRTNTGACGSLMDALMYERMIELSFIDPTRTWADRRGFGTLTKGTMLHVPIPRAQQQVIGLTYYTFGGSGPGSAQ